MTRELPVLAAYADLLASAGHAGFPTPETVCLVQQFRNLYRRHASLAVDFATPLLIGLNAEQVNALQQRFAREYADDRPGPGGPDLVKDRIKRTKRYVETIEAWRLRLKQVIDDPWRGLLFGLGLSPGF